MENELRECLVGTGRFSVCRELHNKKPAITDRFLNTNIHFNIHKLSGSPQERTFIPNEKAPY